MVFSARTMFLAFRAVDQTGRVFDTLNKKMETLEEKQRAVARASYRLMFAGGALVAFSVMAGRALFGTLDATTRGARALGDYETAMQRVKKAFAEGIMDNFGPQIEGLIDNIDELSKNDKFWDLISGIVIPVTFVGAAAGMIFLAASIVASFLNALITVLTTFGILTGGAAGTAAAATAGISTFLSLAIPIGIVLAVMWTTYTFDLFGVRTTMEKIRNRVNEIKVEVFGEERAQRAEYMVLTGMGRDIGTYQEQYYPGVSGPGGVTTVESNVTIETFISSLDDEDFVEVMTKILVDAIENTQGTTTTGPGE